MTGRTPTPETAGNNAEEVNHRHGHGRGVYGHGGYGHGGYGGGRRYGPPVIIVPPQLFFPPEFYAPPQRFYAPPPPRACVYPDGFGGSFVAPCPRPIQRRYSPYGEAPAEAAPSLAEGTSPPSSIPADVAAQVSALDLARGSIEGGAVADTPENIARTSTAGPRVLG
ncbi:MAG: hypothetical protein K2Q12_06880 [Rickettsiales bacterium]|nr:hypothetical protein [Rickettsiales bacterium]